MVTVLLVEIISTTIVRVAKIANTYIHQLTHVFLYVQQGILRAEIRAVVAQE